MFRWLTGPRRRPSRRHARQLRGRLADILARDAETQAMVDECRPLGTRRPGPETRVHPPGEIP